MPPKRKATTTAAPTDTAAAFSISRNSMMEEGGDTTVLEVQSLRTLNADLTTQIARLQSQEETLQGLLVSTYQTRAPSANVIQGIELPDWFPRDTDKPFVVIKQALENLDKVNNELKSKCLELQNREAQHAQKILDMNREQAAGVTKKITEAKMMEDVEETEATALRNEVAELKLYLQHERDGCIGADKGRNDLLEAYMKSEKAARKLEQANMRLMNDNAILKSEAVQDKLLQSSIDAIRGEANTRIVEYQRREETTIEQIKANAEQQIERAHSAQKAAEERLEQMIAAKDELSTLESQHFQASKELRANAKAASERATSLESDKQRLSEHIRHLQDTQSAIMESENTAVAKAKVYEEALHRAKKSTEVFNDQIKDANKSIDTYVAQEEVFVRNAQLHSELVTQAEKLEKNLQFVMGRAEYYKKELQAVLSRRDADNATRDRMTMEDLDGLLD